MSRKLKRLIFLLLPARESGRACACLRALSSVSVLPAKTEGWFSQLVGPTNRLFKTRVVSRMWKISRSLHITICVKVTSLHLYLRLQWEILVDFFPLNSNKNIFRTVFTFRDKYAHIGQIREELDKKENKVQESRHEVAQEWTRVVTLLSLHRGEANWAELMSGFDKATIKPGKLHYRTSYEIQDKRKKTPEKRETQQMKPWRPCSSIIRNTIEVGRKLLFFHLHDAP